MKEDNMQYLIIKEINYENMENTYRVMDFTSDINKANDMLQGYKLVEKNKDVIYSIVRYETPLVLTKEVA